MLSNTWWASRTSSAFDPAAAAAVTAYELVLLVAAAAFVPALRRAALERRHLADRLLADGSPTGVDGLARLLARVLHDEALAASRPHVACAWRTTA